MIDRKSLHKDILELTQCPKEIKTEDGYFTSQQLTHMTVYLQTVNTAVKMLKEKVNESEKS